MNDQFQNQVLIQDLMKQMVLGYAHAKPLEVELVEASLALNEMKAGITVRKELLLG